MIRTSRTMFMVAACAVLTLTGCSVTTSEEPTLSEKTLEQNITDSLEKSVGQRPDSVDCPGSVKAKAGERTRCVLSAGNVRFGLTATITSYDDASGNAKYDVKVDEKPMS
jgi:hypothetical protein